MIRTVKLAPETNEALVKLALRLGVEAGHPVSVSELVRQGIEHVLKTYSAEEDK